ncbi:MAG: hypothetical protein ABSD70_06575 [Terracidiphilus sp.]|jgi:hypothetical protein
MSETVKLFEAAKRGSLDEVASIARSHPEIINQRDGEGASRFITLHSVAIVRWSNFSCSTAQTSTLQTRNSARPLQAGPSNTRARWVGFSESS